MISINTRGSFQKTEMFLARLKRREQFRTLEKYGHIGVAALAAATPHDTSLTANSWTYEIVERAGYYSIRWHNTHVEDGIPIAILLQYGHGTKTGGFVHGRDYINPAMQPIFDKIAADMWKEVTK